MSFIIQHNYDKPFEFWYSRLTQVRYQPNAPGGDPGPLPDNSNVIYSLAPKQTLTGGPDCFFFFESVYVSDPATGLKKRQLVNNRIYRHIRVQKDGWYLKCVAQPEVHPDAVYFDIVQTPNNDVNTVFEIIYYPLPDENPPEPRQKWRCALYNEGLQKTILFEANDIDRFGNLRDWLTKARPRCDPPEQASRISIKEFVFEHPFKWCLRSHCGLYAAFMPASPWVQFTNNKLTWETWVFRFVKWPNYYSIYNPHYNRYMAVDGYYNNQDRIIGYRDNAYNSYDPSFFPMAQWTIQDIHQQFREDFYPLGRGKYLIQNVGSGHYLSTDAYLPTIPAFKAVAAKKMNIDNVDGVQYERHLWELEPQEFNRIGPCSSVPPIYIRQ